MKFLILLFTLCAISNSFAQTTAQMTPTIIAPPTETGPTGAPTEPTEPETPPDHTRLKIFWDCFLPGEVDCGDLSQAFLNADRFSNRVSDASDADVRIVLRVWEFSAVYDQYEIEFQGKAPLPTFKLTGHPLRFRHTLSTQGKLLNLINNLIRGITVFHTVVNYQNNPNGQLVVTYQRSAGEPQPPSSNSQPWVVSAQTGTSINSYGSLNINAFATTEVRYLQRRWALAMAGAGYYQYLSLPNGDGTSEHAGNFSTGAIVTALRSIAHHWSVAVVARERHNPASNYDSRTQLHAGIEYELIPFLETNDRTLSVTYLIGGNYENYRYANIDGENDNLLATHAISLYYLNHSERVDFSITGGASALVNDPRIFALGSRLNLRLYITQNLNLDLSGDVGYRRNILNAPMDSSVDPVLTLLGYSGATQPVTYSINFNITYRWGNTLLGQRDTRWRNTSLDLPLNF